MLTLSETVMGLVFLGRRTGGWEGRNQDDVLVGGNAWELMKSRQLANGVIECYYQILINLNK